MAARIIRENEMSFDVFNAIRARVRVAMRRNAYPACTATIARWTTSRSERERKRKQARLVTELPSFATVNQIAIRQAHMHVYYVACIANELGCVSVRRDEPAQQSGGRTWKKQKKNPICCLHRADTVGGMAKEIE